MAIYICQGGLKAEGVSPSLPAAAQATSAMDTGRPARRVRPGNGREKPAASRLNEGRSLTEAQAWHTLNAPERL